MIPLRDANPTRQRPIVTYALIAICVVVFGVELWIQTTDGDAALERFITDYGAVASRITEAPPSSALLGLITSQFLHAGWLHLGGNMLYLWIFGNNVEDRFGRVRFLLFYLAGGVVAALSQIATAPGSTGPLIGASGAIAAVLGAYLVLYPGARVLSLVFLGFFYQLIQVPAVIILVLWFALQLISGVTSLGAATSSGDSVAFFAHIGGFVLGAVVGFVVRTVGRGRRVRDARPDRYGVG
ncbi:MAG TPA: rhomboid family intramembrane serine protease [Candidatus Limnocylindrales bacterium]|nr:rhomboid family intramembrane serine protease [Candidatus Limnocylindrales bacterium]